MTASLLIGVLYSATAVCLVLSLMWMSSSLTERRGLCVAAVAMTLLALGTLLLTHMDDQVVVARLIGAIIGVPLAVVGPLSTISASARFPFLSLANAIVGAAILGAVATVGSAGEEAQRLGVVAVDAALVSLTGFLITDRMLKMFKKGPSK